MKKKHKLDNKRDTKTANRLTLKKKKLFSLEPVDHKTDLFFFSSTSSLRPKLLSGGYITKTKETFF